MTLDFTGLAQGFLIGAGLIVAIGAQNAFVLRQGLKREHVFTVVLICAFCDALLTTIGVNGLGGFLSRSPTLTRIGTLGGALFLLYFAIKSFRSAFQSKELDANASPVTPPTRKAIALQAMAFSLLNPHAILDTVVLLGTVGAQYEFERRQSFLAGAILASLTWFFVLGYGASALAPLFRRPKTWRILDTVIGIVMLAIATSLLRTLFV